MEVITSHSPLMTLHDLSDQDSCQALTLNLPINAVKYSLEELIQGNPETGVTSLALFTLPAAQPPPILNPSLQARLLATPRDQSSPQTLKNKNGIQSVS